MPSQHTKLIFFDISGVLLVPQSFKNVLSRKSSLTLGMEEIIKELSKNHRLIVVSSLSKSSLDHYLEEWNLRKHFDHIISSFDKSSDMRNTMKTYRALPQECILITDTCNDIRAAQAVDIKTLAVTWGYGNEESLKNCNATKIINHPNEITTHIN